MDAVNRDAIALPFGRGHRGGGAENFLRGSAIMIRESSQVGGLGSMVESDIAHCPSTFVFLSRIAKNSRRHNRPADVKDVCH